MIKVGVFYPLTAKFDWDYYLGKHMKAQHLTTNDNAERLAGARAAG